MCIRDRAEGFKEVFSKDIVNYGNVRGLYIGETFYLVAGNTVESFTLNGFEKIGDERKLHAHARVKVVEEIAPVFKNGGLIVCLCKLIVNVLKSNAL